MIATIDIQSIQQKRPRYIYIYSRTNNVGGYRAVSLAATSNRLTITQPFNTRLKPTIHRLSFRKTSTLRESMQFWFQHSLHFYKSPDIFSDIPPVCPVPFPIFSLVYLLEIPEVSGQTIDMEVFVPCRPMNQMQFMRCYGISAEHALIDHPVGAARRCRRHDDQR